MRNVFKTLPLLTVMILMCVIAHAENTSPESTDFMRSNGKIYVVVAVVVTIVLGIFIYLLNLDKKISRLEKDGNIRK